LRGTCHPVEKVGIELIVTTNRARKVPKQACLVVIWGQSKRRGSFLNGLVSSANLACTECAEGG
jgi:hypothetical protein